MNVGDIVQTGFSIGPEYGGQHMVIAQGASQRIADGLRLLEDFLEHEVTVFALIQAMCGMLVTRDGPLDQLFVAVPHVALVQADTGVVAFFQIAEAVCDLQQGERIGCQIPLAAAFTNNQRAAHARAIQGIGFGFMDDGQCIGAVDFIQGGAEGGQHVLALAVVMG